MAALKKGSAQLCLLALVARHPTYASQMLSELRDKTEFLPDLEEAHARVGVASSF